MPDEVDRLLLWEAAAGRAPIDRALLFAAGAGAADAADLAVDARDRAVLSLRGALFGDVMPARIVCRACDEPLDVPLSAAALAEAEAEPPAGVRAPTSRDLADALALGDPDEGRRLLAARAAGVAPDEIDAARADAVEAALEAAGAPGDIVLDYLCPGCGAEGRAGLDPAAWLWRELDAAATAVMAEVATLARAYGWTEPQALALSPARRARYLSLAEAAG